MGSLCLRVTLSQKQHSRESNVERIDHSLLTNFKDDSGMALKHRVENESQVRPIYPKTQFHSSVSFAFPVINRSELGIF